MNIQIISVVSEDGKDLDYEGSYYEGFTGLYSFVDNIKVGEIIKFRHILYKYSLFVNEIVIEHSFDEENRIHIVKSKDAIFTFEELDYNENKKKKINSTLYMGTRLGYRSFQVPKEKNRYLFSHGRYPTKIYASDLPEWYVFGYIYKRYGYISAKGVKYLLYNPNYTVENHYLKYDTLFVSYKDEIEKIETTETFSWYKGYDHAFGGSLIVSFIEAVKKYSDCDVSEIEAELERKKEWYLQKNK